MPGCRVVALFWLRTTKSPPAAERSNAVAHQKLATHEKNTYKRKKLTAQLNETKKRTLQELLNTWLQDVHLEVVEGNGR